MRPIHFGRALRAANQGFFWSYPHRCFIRLIVIGPELFFAELLGEMDDPPEPQRRFVCWAEGMDSSELIEASPALRRLRESGGKQTPGHETWLLDFDGERVTEGDRFEAFISRHRLAAEPEPTDVCPRGASAVKLKVDGDRIQRAIDNFGCSRCGHPRGFHDPARGACAAFMVDIPR